MAGAAGPPTLLDGQYYVVLWDSNPMNELMHVWDVSGNNKNVGAHVGKWSFQQVVNQRFRVTRTPQGSYTFSPAHSGLTIEIFNASPVLGEMLVQNNACVADPPAGHQLFHLHPELPLADGRVFYRIQPAHMGPDVALELTADNIIRQAIRSADKPAQLFYFMKV
jgi:hypothetical protein